ncbi:MAG: hypothetical protein HYZ34_04625 [Ignavibacteriae bacterium]|nr:hypothetical protein [Ignavibacteriota bacterium]
MKHTTFFLSLFFSVSLQSKQMCGTITFFNLHPPQAAAGFWKCYLTQLELK